MANLVNLELVRKAYGTRTLLDGVSLGVADGERIGVVGRNGGGKTTLLRTLAKSEEPDGGRVTHTGGLRVAVVDQQDRLDGSATVRAEVLGSRADHEWASDARVRDIFTGLFGGLDLPGFPSGLDTVIAPLSGGERRRIALAKALVDQSDLLLLDEPTNHLDVEGIAWLARHLVARRGAVVVVTHDRWFLDEVATRTWEVAGGAVHDYEGGYSSYVLARAERERLAASDWAKRQNLLRKELAWLRRGPPARTSKPKFRIDAANALIEGEPPARDAVELTRLATSRLGRTVFETFDVTLAVGSEPRVLLEHLTWQLGPGERLGLVGVNGAGKTSLLRLLLGELAPLHGRVVTGVTVKAAHLSQEVTDVDPSLRVLEAVESVRAEVSFGSGSKRRELTASQLLERFGFLGEKQWTRVADLSGGERRRLQLLRLLMDEPNVLVLDEPTNDLDIDTLTAVEDLLDGWPGSLIVVSHDRYFLERTTDRIAALLGDRRLLMLPGGVDEYLERRASVVAAAPASTPAVERSTAAKDDRATKKEMARIERRLERIGEREAELHARLAEEATDYVAVAKLDEELRELQRERGELEDVWLELAD